MAIGREAHNCGKHFGTDRTKPARVLRTWSARIYKGVRALWREPLKLVRYWAVTAMGCERAGDRYWRVMRWPTATVAAVVGLLAIGLVRALRYVTCAAAFCLLVAFLMRR
jgi:hypothetical protein